MAEDARSQVEKLMARKDQIENEIRQFYDVLQSQKVGMADELVDKDGFPRSDVDVHTVRIARNKIICLKNDLNDVMKDIEEGLHKVHALAKQSRSVSQEEQMDTSKTDSLAAFLKVDLVSQGSPAEKAGLMLGDLILCFGSVTASNFTGLPSIGSIVQHSKGKPLTLMVKRDNTINQLTLTPNTWSGRGLLGCNIVITKE